MNHEAVYRTAPATPGLLITSLKTGPGANKFFLSEVLKAKKKTIYNIEFTQK